jgi:hypothetical protein
LRPTDPINRRALLRRAGGGFGLLALADLFAGGGMAGDAPGPHHRATAKSVISLFMNGGPSQVDQFDPKPELQRRDGERLAKSEGLDVFFGAPGPLMASPFKFARHGKSGQWVSELLPETAKVIDEVALIRSMHADSNNHAPALFQMNTGFTRPGNPSLGAWTVYGLGSANRNLPSFVVLCDPVGGPIGGSPNWGSGYLPASHQGTPFRSEGEPILDLSPPPDVSAGRRRAGLDLLNAINRDHAESHPGEADLIARIESHELAFRMQAEAPEAVDLARESAETRRLYGLENPVTASFGRRLLIARRLVERGVRFVQVYSGGGAFEDNWDAHYDLVKNHRKRCGETDGPVAALIVDLKRRGLLDETLVLWGGEFGRMPVSQARIGRDHNPHGFTAWMAGGGVKGGVSIGKTDDLGHRAVEDKVHVHDWHATILHLMGLDHTRLTFPDEGRAKRLTDVSGRVVGAIL